MIFFDNARITKNNGCYFYDQDIIILDYAYSGDSRIKLKLDYVNPGFGILLIEDSDSKFNSKKQYMFKLGDDDYAVIEKLDDGQNQIEYSTIQFKHLLKDAYVVLEYENNKASFYLEKNNKKVLMIIQDFPIEFSSYRIGLYSQYGNTVESLQVSSGLPIGWAANVISTVGGRLYYYDNTIKFENCTYEAQTETDFIKLKAGIYYLKYNAAGDIKAAAFASSDPSIELNKKNILKDDKIVLEEDSYVSIQFYGKDGIVSNISLQETANGSYLPSSGNGSLQEGSYLHFILDNISSIHLSVQITELPESENLTYYYFKFGDRVYTPKDFPIGEYIDVVYDRKTLTIKYADKTIRLNRYDSNILDMFYNVNAYIKKLVIINKDNKEENLLSVSETYSHITNELDTPILCLDENDEPFDLSSSYREVIIPTVHIDMFNKYNPMKLSHQLNTYQLDDIQVIGIKEHCQINPDAKNFNDSIVSETGFQYIDFNPAININIDLNSLVYDKDIHNKYKYIAIMYPTADTYMYKFTNWSREYFDNKNNVLQLAHPILNTFNNINIYGMNKEPKLNLFYRVRQDKETSDIKLTANTYDIVDNASFDIDFKKNRIELKNNNYKYYIVEYLKKDSYCINDLKYNTLLNKDSSNLYEVKISTNKENFRLVYDQDEKTKTINKYKLTDINLTPNRYVTLRSV